MIPKPTVKRKRKLARPNNPFKKVMRSLDEEDVPFQTYDNPEPKKP